MTPGDQVPAQANESASAANSHIAAARAARMADMRADFLDFFDRNYHPLVRFVMLNGAALQDAQDAVQEAFLQALERLEQPNGWETIRNPHAWIRKVALNKYRRPPGVRRRPCASPAADIPDVSQPAATDHGELTTQAQYVLAMLGGLDEEARAVMAFHIDGFSIADIASHLDITDQRVRDQLKKARKILRHKLADPTRKEGGTR